MERQNEGPDISINGTTELSSKLKVSHQNHVYFILNRQNISYAFKNLILNQIPFQFQS